MPEVFASYSHSSLDVTPEMTSNNAPSPCVVTTTVADSGRDGYLAFNHNGSNPAWEYGDACPQSIIFDLGSGNEKVVVAYTLTSNDDAWKKWVLYGSNDGTNWTTLDTQAGGTTFSVGSYMQKWTFANSTAFRYYKLTETHYDSYGGFIEIELLEAEPAPEINALINLSSILSIGGTLMRGKAGDVETAISIPLSFGASVDVDNNRVYVNGSIPLALSFGGTIYSYSSYLGLAYLYLPIFQISAQGIIHPLGTGSIKTPMLTLNASGDVTEAGISSLSLPRLKLTANGLSTISGTADLKIPMLKSVAQMAQSIVGTAYLEVPIFQLVTLAYSSVIGIGAVTIPMFEIYSKIAGTVLKSLVINVKTSGLTTFENYLFNSMCHFQGKNLGATATSINDLDLGNTDNGAIIDWNFKIGQIDLHLKTKKKLRQAWLSCQISGNLIVTVITADGDEYEYKATSYAATEEGVRVKFGKGIRSKYVSLDVKNEEVSAIELDAIRLNLDSAARKLR